MMKIIVRAAVGLELQMFECMECFWFFKNGC